MPYSTQVLREKIEKPQQENEQLRIMLTEQTERAEYEDWDKMQQAIKAWEELQK